MVQKEFQRIKSWKEFRKLWDKNDKYEIALGLLHIGPDIIGTNHLYIPDEISESDLREVKQKSSRKKLDKKELGEAISFYIRVACWVDMLDTPDTSSLYMTGRKAYQVLVHRFSKLLDHLPENDPVFGELADFFSKERKMIYWSKEQPYKGDMQKLLTTLWAKTREKPDDCPDSIEKILPTKKSEITRALVHADLFDFIRENRILEAIPALQKEVCYWLRMTSTDFLEGPRGMMTELDKPYSGALRYALDTWPASEGARVLLELLIRRDVTLPRK